HRDGSSSLLDQLAGITRVSRWTTPMTTLRTTQRSTVAIAMSLMLTSLQRAAIAQSEQPQPSSHSTSPTDPGWPRTFTQEGTTVLLYQPQVDSWKDYEKIKFRCAIEVTSADGQKPSLGVLAVEADTDVDHESNSVIMTNLKVDERFPGVSEQEAAALSALV